MLIRKLKDIPEFIAGDKTALKEILHPNKDYNFSGRYSLALAKLGLKQKSDLHRLKSNEVYYIICGTGRIFVNDESAVVTAGDTIEIKAGENQALENIGTTELEFLCIVDPAWQIEDEEIL